MRERYGILGRMARRPSDPMWSARLKFERASEHLKALDQEVLAFARNERDRIAAVFDPETDWVALPSWTPITLPADVKTLGQFGVTLPSRFVLILGDYLANLRSALDHAVYGMAGAKAGKYTKFPIYPKEDRWKEDAHVALAGIDGPRRTQIQLMQPYKGHRRGKVLLRLSELVNYDKHKVLHAVAGLIYQAITFPGQGEDRSVWYRDTGILGDETEVSIKFRAIGEPEVQGGAPYQMMFSNAPPPDGAIVANRVDLATLMEEVRLVIYELGLPIVDDEPLLGPQTEPPFG